MWRVGGDITEKRLVLVLCDKVHALAKEHVRTIARERRRLSVHKIRIVEIVVAPGVAGIADAAAGVVDRFIKAALVWAVGGAIAQVPLAKMAGAIAVFAQRIGQGPLVFTQ